MSVSCLGMSAGVAWEGERGCLWVENQWHLLCYASPFSIAQSLREFQRKRKPKSDRTSLFFPPWMCLGASIPLCSLSTHITILHAASSLDSFFLLPWDKLGWFLQGWHHLTHTSAKSLWRQVWRLVDQLDGASGDHGWDSVDSEKGSDCKFILQIELTGLTNWIGYRV